MYEDRVPPRPLRRTDDEPRGRGRMLARMIAAALVCLAALGAIARLRGFEYGPLLYLVAATPYLVLAMAPAFLLGLLGRSWRWTSLSLVLGIVLMLTQLSLFRASDDRDAKAKAFTVMTVNLDGGRADAADLVRQATGRQPDLLAVQELTPEAEAALRKAGLDKVLAFNYVVAAPGVVGTGLWSRYALTQTRQLPGFFMNQLVAKVAAPAPAPADLTVAVVHPYAPADLRHRQWSDEQSRLRTELVKLPGSVVAVGDFNATTDLSPLRLLRRDGYRNAVDGAGAGVVRTWGPWASKPSLFGVDHVLVRGPMSGGRVERIGVPGARHQGLVAELRR